LPFVTGDGEIKLFKNKNVAINSGLSTSQTPFGFISRVYTPLFTPFPFYLYTDPTDLQDNVNLKASPGFHCFKLLGIKTTKNN